MNALELFNAHSKTWVKNGVFYKKYSGLPDWRWVQIATASMTLSNEKISPPLLTIYHSKHTISWKEVIPFEPGMDELPEGVLISVAEIRKQMTKLVSKLHDIGYIHGDLHLGNIGVIDGNRVVILDFDSIIRMGRDDDEEWVQTYLREAYPDQDIETVEDLAEEEITSWRTDLLFR